jgi:hypothetical protein
MAWHTNRPLRRAIGSLFGVAFLAVGGGALAVTGDDRVFWYGATGVLISLIAIVCSWTVKDPDTIWCRHPRHPVIDTEKAVTKGPESP